MKSVLLIVCLGLGIAGGGVAAAQSMEGTGTEVAGDVSCTIFPPAQIMPGQPFDVRVSRVPGYPGVWFAPTIYLKLRYPTEAGWAYEQRVSKTIPKMGAIRTDFSLLAPYSIYPDPQGGFVPGGTVSILAIVLEPTTGAPIRTLCTASTTISP